MGFLLSGARFSESVFVSGFVFVLLCLGSTVGARDIGEHETLSCHSYGYGKNCTDHGCSVCLLKAHWLPDFVPLQRVCVKNSTAAHLKMLYDCCSGDDPAPTPPHASLELVLTGEPCPQNLDRVACADDPACTWCESRAVPSQCYTREEAHMLPVGVFECDTAGGDMAEMMAYAYGEPLLPF
jgi:hypothetical protein